MKVDTNKMNIFFKKEAIVSALKVDFSTVVPKSLHHLQQNHLRRDLKMQILRSIPGTSDNRLKVWTQSVCLEVVTGLSDNL